VISEFRGQYRFLNNFWPASIMLDGVAYPTVEHAFQAAKFASKAIREQIRACPTPGEAKRLARWSSRDINQEWYGEMRLRTMRNLLRLKFDDKELARRLVATRPQELREGNTWGDLFWGVDKATGHGENHLGRMLMELREELWLYHEHGAGRPGFGGPPFA